VKRIQYVQSRAGGRKDRARPEKREDGRGMRLFGQLSLFHALFYAFSHAFFPASFRIFSRGLGA